MGAGCCRVTVWGLSVTVMFFAMVLAGIGVFAPNWWYLHVNETLGGLQMEYTFGLWMICRRGRQVVTGIDSVPGSYRWLCLPRDRIDPGTTPYNHATEIHYQTLITLSVGFATGSLSLLVAFCSMCLPYLSILYGLMSLASCGLVTAATAVYYIDTSNREDMRQFVSTLGTTYFLENDICVYCCMVSSGLLFFNLLLTVAVCITSIMHKRKQNEQLRAEKYRYVEMHRPRSRHDDDFGGGGGGGGVRSRSHSQSRPPPQEPTKPYRDSYTQAYTQSYRQPQIIVVDRPAKHTLY